MSVDKMDMSLDELIEKSSGNNNRQRGTRNTNLRTRGSRNNRNNRASKPYDEGRAVSKEGDIETKFLVSNYLAGMLIGKGGARIKRFAGMTKTNIVVSSQDVVYPGTTMRYITIKGSVKAVTLVVSIFWELIALEEKELNLGPRNIWIPQPHMSHLFDNDHVEARLVVPAKTVGRIIGKDMTTIKSFVESTGAIVNFAKRFEPSLPGESDRVLTIAGTVMACAEVSELILEKVKEYVDDKNSGEPIVDVDRVAPSGTAGRRSGRTLPQRRKPTKVVASAEEYDSEVEDEDEVAEGDAEEDPTFMGLSSGKDAGRINRQVRASVAASAERGGGAEVVSASTTVSLAVPDNLVGNIIGPKGNTLRSLISETGADVVISTRGDFVPGTENRLVTVTGEPAAVAQACQMVNQLLEG